MIKDKVGLHILEPIMRKVTKKIVATDDAAITEFVRQHCDQLRQMGEPLYFYELVRTTDTSINGVKVTYKIEYVGPKDEAQQ